jgi:hypothetical protein
MHHESVATIDREAASGTEHTRELPEVFSSAYEESVFERQKGIK